MFALTTIVKKQDGSHVWHDGALLKLPLEMSGQARVLKYLGVKSSGWSKDDLRYDLYARHDFHGNLIIIPGIILPDSQGAKRFPEFLPKFPKEQIESYVEGIIELEKEALESASENINMLVHDLRNISGSIYNAALEAETFINRGNMLEAKVRVQNVMAAQNILKIRTDVLDFLGNPASIVRLRQIEIYRKVDKVCRVFKSKAQERKIQINFSGASYLTAEGPEIFEIVPYVLIDNAIKYSPSGSFIDVVVEDVGDYISIEVASLGPKILEHEKLAIFEKGVRGSSAQAWAVPGSGLGLYLMSQMIKEYFDGQVTVVQSTDSENYIDGKTYYETAFLIRLPGVKASSYPSIRFGLR